jgi:hypothetical protein
VSFTILNGVDGTQINTLGVTIDGYQAILNGSFVNSYTGNIYPSTGRYVVGIYPKRPNFIRGAAQIRVRMQVLDGYNNVDSYGYSFYTDGYNATTLEPVETGSSRVCSISFPFFPPSDLGLSIAYDEGTGTEATLEWKAAVPYDEDNVIYYNIYNNTKRISVFDGYPDFIVSDTSTTIGGFAPGDTNFFGVRVAEFDPDAFTTSGMSIAGSNMYYYPSNARIDGYIGADTLIIPATTTEGFPDYGILIIDSELVRYSIKNYSPARFIISSTGRGYASTTAAAHYNSEIVLYPGTEDRNTIIAQATPTFQKPNYAKTYILGDGYGADGYRDGYDGYAYTDGYLKYKEETIDSITTDGKNNNESGTFPRFDYCGSWRASSPQSFMQGQCTRSYFGGAQVRIDDDGYRHSVKTDVKTQLLQREELLLESSGEPFILIRRMWTGMRCSCFMLRREHPDARCPICFGVGFAQGYIQFFNPRRSDRRILIRINPATDDLSIVDRGGFEPVYEPDGWTLPFPQLKDRDMLVRFNEDNTEAWRYEVLNVTRNKVLFAQSGAQLIKIKRLPKTGIIYQFPVVRDTSPYPETITTSVSSVSGIPSHSHQIVVPDDHNILTLKGATLESEGHNHIIYNGIIQGVLDHTHVLL